MRTIVTILLLIFSPLVLSAEKIDRDWLGLDKRDSWLFYTSSVLLVIDTAQTHWIAKNPQNPDYPGLHYYESNAWLGRHPSNSRINSYFLYVGLLSYLANRFLPRPLKYVWGLGTIGIEFKAVRGNYTMGVSADF